MQLLTNVKWTLVNHNRDVDTLHFKYTVPEPRQIIDVPGFPRDLSNLVNQFANPCVTKTCWPQQIFDDGSTDCQEYCNERTDYSALAARLTKQWEDNLKDITGKLTINGDTIKLKNMRSMSFESFTPEQMIEKRNNNIAYSETDAPVLFCALRGNE